MTTTTNLDCYKIHLLHIPGSTEPDAADAVWREFCESGIDAGFAERVPPAAYGLKSFRRVAVVDYDKYGGRAGTIVAGAYGDVEVFFGTANRVPVGAIAYWIGMLEGIVAGKAPAPATIDISRASPDMRRAAIIVASEHSGWIFDGRTCRALPHIGVKGAA